MDRRMLFLTQIESYGGKFRGRTELIAHLSESRPLTLKARILAKCYECSNYYADPEDKDCKMHQCPLYPVMPYNKSEKTVRTKRVVSEEERARLSEQLKTARAKK